MTTRKRVGALLVASMLWAVGCSSEVSSGSPGTGSQSGSSGGSGPNGGTGSTTGSGGSGNPGSGGGVGTGSGGSGNPGSGGGVGTGSGGTSGTACSPLAPIPRRLWRLSLPQYANATTDLLTLTSPVKVESTTDGMSAYALFSNTSLDVNANILFSGFYQTAENILTQIAPRIASIAGCTSGEAQTACAMRFATEFGRKAFRRPLESSEVTNLMAVYTAGASADFNTGISLMIEALILSPSFLYRTELGPSTLTADASGKFPDTTLTPYEVATQLGFMLLNSTPDAALLEAAKDNSLSTTAGVSAQVTRLLGSTATKTNLTNVFTNWFSLGQLGDKTKKDTALLSKLGAADQDQNVLVGDLLTSAQQFITDTIWTANGKVTDLATSQKVFVNKRLATLFGLTYTGSGTAFQSATFPATQQRIGMLSQPAFLWAVSDSAATSIVKRGRFFHDNIVCQDALPPPIDLTTPTALAVIAMGDSEVTKSDARMNKMAPCYACHAQMDPYARVLENFDPIGNYRTVDEANRMVDPTVTFTGNSPLAPQTINGPAQFGQALVSSKAFAGCAVQQMTSFTIGTLIEKYNTCEVQELRNQFDKSDGTATSLFSQIALANFVRARAGGVK